MMNNSIASKDFNVLSESINVGGGIKENVKVMVRCRPNITALTESEANIQIDEQCSSIILGDRKFCFDAIFGPETDNETLYLKSVRNLVESTFNGFNSTVFLYGQTGTGKTYTHSNLVISSINHLFSLISESEKDTSFLVRVSYCEIYNEEIRDLLSDSYRPLDLKESKMTGVYIKNLSCILVNNLNDVRKLKINGDKRRMTGSTNMNKNSSRSHTIFSIIIEVIKTKVIDNDIAIKHREHISSKENNKKPEYIRVGRIDLVDLAGSERQIKSGSTGSRLKEASQINLSLTCLSLVIRALTDDKSTHIPYRNSKLTRLLSTSLGGNSKTLLLACISQSANSLSETLNTLRFASRAKRIENNATINEDTNHALLRRYQQQIDELKVQLNTVKTERDIKIHSSSEKLYIEEGQNDNLIDQLNFLKTKIIIGGENLLDKVDFHDKLLKASQQELILKRQEQERLRKKLDKKNDELKQLQLTKSSMETQKIDLDKKINKAKGILHDAKNEVQDLEDDHATLKETLLNTIKDISMEIKYADGVINEYIPANFLELIMANAHYDEDSEEWQIKYIAFSGNNIIRVHVE